MKNKYKILKSKFASFFTQGISVKDLSLAIAFGICIGIIPVLGVATLLCTGVALFFRLNMPVIQAINYAVYPLQLILFIPFFQAGTFFSGQKFNYSVSDIQLLIKKSLIEAIHLFLQANLYALLVWLFLIPILFGTIYFCSLFFLKGLEKKRT